MHTWVKKRRHVGTEYMDSNNIIFIAKISCPCNFSLFKLQLP